MGAELNQIRTELSSLLLRAQGFLAPVEYASTIYQEIDFQQSFRRLQGRLSDMELILARNALVLSQDDPDVLMSF